MGQLCIDDEFGGTPLDPPVGGLLAISPPTGAAKLNALRTQITCNCNSSAMLLDLLDELLWERGLTDG